MDATMQSGTIQERAHVRFTPECNFDTKRAHFISIPPPTDHRYGSMSKQADAAAIERYAPGRGKNKLGSEKRPQHPQHVCFAPDCVLHSSSESYIIRMEPEVRYGRRSRQGDAAAWERYTPKAGMGSKVGEDEHEISDELPEIQHGLRDVRNGSRGLMGGIRRFIRSLSPSNI